MSSTEATFSLEKVRTLRSVEASAWLGHPGLAHWCEWDHWGETPRSFTSIIDTLERENWARLIRPGSLCVDIGAHSGDTAIPMGLFCYDAANQRKGHVLAIEPNPAVFGVLEINLALNESISHFRSAQVAVTATDVEQIELADHGNASCNGGVLQGGYSAELESTLERSAGIRYFAKGRTLESVLTDNFTEEQIRTLSFVKTDLEGYDKNVIRSSAAILTALKPTLFVEWFAWFTPEDDADLFAAIDEVGYVPLHPVTMEPMSASSARVPDLTCVHRSHATAL